MIAPSIRAHEFKTERKEKYDAGYKTPGGFCQP